MTKLDSQVLSQINQELHWAFEYLGTQWEKNSKPPQSFDCWTFFKFIQLKHFGIEVPDFETVDSQNFRAVADMILNANERELWKAMNTPTHGCAVLMAHARYPSHVGVYLDVDGGGVLHCVRGEGVVFSTLSALKTCGWGRVEFYKHVSNT